MMMAVIGVAVAAVMVVIEAIRSLKLRVSSGH